jgi:hypothetical protein
LEKNTSKISTENLTNGASFLFKTLKFKDQLQICEIFFNLNTISTDVVNYILHQVKGFDFENMPIEETDAHFHAYSKVKKL